MIASLLALPAQAQNWGAWNDPTGKAVRLTVNLQIATPVNSDASAADLTKALAQANQSLYDIIDHQCDAISAALKGDCRIVQLNVNGNINERMQQFVPPGERPNQRQMVNANANATFLVEPSPKGVNPAQKDAPAQRDPATQQ
jgi:hypothetical protein